MDLNQSTETRQARLPALLVAVKSDSDDGAGRAPAVHIAGAPNGGALGLCGKTAVQLPAGRGMTDELPFVHGFKRLVMFEAAPADTDHHLAAFATPAKAV